MGTVLKFPSRAEIYKSRGVEQSTWTKIAYLEGNSDRLTAWEHEFVLGVQSFLHKGTETLKQMETLDRICAEVRKRVES